MLCLKRQFCILSNSQASKEIVLFDPVFILDSVFKRYKQLVCFLSLSRHLECVCSRLAE